MNKEKIEALIDQWQKRNISGLYCADKARAKKEILRMIPPLARVGFSGSVSLEQMGLIKELKARGNPVCDPYKEGVSRQESLEIRREGAAADYYLASPNAIAESGELVFFSGFGNRTAGVAYARNLILVAGVNKIAADIKEALRRAREYATPLNCRRLNWSSACLKDGKCRQEICFSPEYKRMCCQVLIIEAEAVAKRVNLILIGEELGY